MNRQPISTGKVTITYMDGSVRVIDLSADSKVLEINGAAFDVFGTLAEHMPHERLEPGRCRVAHVAHA